MANAKIKLYATNTLEEANICVGYNEKLMRGGKSGLRMSTPEWLQDLWNEAGLVSDPENWRLIVMRVSERTVADGLFVNRHANVLALRRNS